MNYSVEKLENSMAKIVCEIPFEKLDEACKKVYEKQKGSISVPGFRKGKVPYQIVLRMYGKSVFYDDALNEILPDAYEEGVKSQDVKVMSRPEVNLEKFEENEPIIVSFTVAVKPEIKLGEYKGLKKETAAVEVTDEDVENELNNVAKRNARKLDITDRAAQLDDTATIDFTGSVDGVEFEGGKGTDFDLKLGSHSFIDNFEDQIVGHNVGDSFDVNVTFPENYGEKELAGKAAVFAVTVKKITADELPEIDDEFASEVSDCDTLDAYKESLKKTLTERKERDAAEQTKIKLIETVTAGAEVELNDKIIMEQCDQMIQEFAQTLSYQGMDMNRYLSMTGSSIDQLREEVKPEATRRLRETLVMEAVANAENLAVTDEEFENELNEMAKAYGMEDASKLKEMLTSVEEENMKAEMLNRKAVDFIVENAID